MIKKHTFYFGFVLATLIGLQSCETREELVVIDENSENIVEATKFAFKEIASGYLTGNGDEEIIKGGLVINTQMEWDALTTKMNSVNNTIEEESVDFSKSTVLVYFDQIRGSGGHDVEFLTISEIGEDVQAIVKTTPPKGDAIEIMTQPYSVVFIEKTGKPASFIEQ